MSLKPIPPDADLELKQWGDTAAPILLAEYTNYGIAQQQAITFSDLLTTYATRLAAAKSPATRTELSIEAKDQAKANFASFARTVCRMVSANPDVSPEQRLAIGLHIPRQPVRRDPPSAVPILDVTSVGPTGIHVRAHSGDALVRRMPEGVYGMTVWTWLGEVPPLDHRRWICQGPFMRPTATIDFGLEAAETTRAWIVVRWFNRRGQGPVSMPAEVGLHGLTLAQQLALQKAQERDGSDPVSQAA